MPTLHIELTEDELDYLGIKNPDEASDTVRELLGLPPESEKEKMERYCGPFTVTTGD